MRCLLIVAVIAFVAVLNCEAKEIPNKFFGKWKLEKDENFDEYLKARGFGWIMRQVIKFASVTKVIRKSEHAGKYDFENLTTKKDTHHIAFELGKEFVDEALDSTKHKITFDMKDSETFSERHVKVDDPNDIEVFEYKVQGDYLVAKMQWGNAVAYRYYKKQ